MDSDMANKKKYQISPARIAAIRERMGLSREEFAAKLGVSRAAVGHWETGIHAATGATVIILKQWESSGKFPLPA